MIRVALFGTYPTQMNGYSKVVYELMMQLSQQPDIQLSIFGFQNFFKHPTHRVQIPQNVYLYDAFANENPKTNGFGIQQVKEFLAAQRPDVIIIYNDVLVISSILKEIEQMTEKNFKIILYVDQVYPAMMKQHIEMINKHANAAILFSEYWKECIIDHGMTIPAYVLEHGFNKERFFPFPRELARKYFGMNEEEYIVLNLNRNQPRKRWDICMKVWAELVSEMKDEPIKLLIGTAPTGGWNILEIYERELKKRGMTLEQGMKHILLLDNAQNLSDADINILYNAADLGITTCDGEGWGLCSFEHAAVGVHQVAPRLGGFLEFFNDDNATLVEPAYGYYIDTSRDMVGGEAFVCNYIDFVDAIKAQYAIRHQKTRDLAFRKHIIEKYDWSKLSAKLVKTIKEVTGYKEPVSLSTPAPVLETVVEEPLLDEPLPASDDINIDDGEVSLNDGISEKTPVQKTEAFVTKDEFNDLQKKLDSILNLLAAKSG